MAEPVSIFFGIAASILTILTIAAPIVTGVLDAEWKIKQLSDIVEGIKGILNHYSDLWRQDYRGLGPIVTHLETCNSALKRLDDDLQKQYKKIKDIDKNGSAKKVRSDKIDHMKRLTWSAWTKSSAKEHLQDIEAAKSSLLMSFTACEAARRQEGVRQVVNQGQQNHASLHREIRDGRFSTEAYLAGLSTKMDAMALASQGPETYEPSDAGADYGDDNNTDEYDYKAGHGSTSRIWVQLSNILYRMQVYVFESQGVQHDAFYTHSLAVDPFMKCSWVSRKYLMQVNLHQQINDYMSRQERSENTLTFGSVSYAPSGSTILLWRPIDGPSAVWTTERFYVFDEIAVPDVNFAVKYRPYESHRPDPDEDRRANGDETSFIDYTLSDEESVQVETEYLPKGYYSRQQAQTGHEAYHTSQTTVAPQYVEQYSDQRTPQAGPSTRTIPRSLRESDDRETAEESRGKTRSRSHRSEQAQGSRSSRPSNDRRRDRDTQNASLEISSRTSDGRRRSKGKQRAYDD